MIFLINSCASVDVDDIPKVTLVQLSTATNQANPEKIKKYDDKNCKLVTETQASFPILLPDNTLNPILNAGVWVSYQDFVSLYRFCSEECRKELNRQLEKLNEKR